MSNLGRAARAPVSMSIQNDPYSHTSQTAPMFAEFLPPGRFSLILLLDPTA